MPNKQHDNSLGRANSDTNHPTYFDYSGLPSEGPSYYRHRPSSGGTPIWVIITAISLASILALQGIIIYKQYEVNKAIKADYAELEQRALRYQREVQSLRTSMGELSAHINYYKGQLSNRPVNREPDRKTEPMVQQDIYYQDASGVWRNKKVLIQGNPTP